MEGLTSHFSFAFSMMSALVTFYFWIVKANKERPRLKLYQADPQLAGHAQSTCGETIKLTFEAKTLVANYSSLPNAVLGVQARIRMRDGSWQNAEARLDPKTALPLNIPPLQTVRLDLALTLAVPALPEGQSCKNTHETFALHRERWVSQPLEVKVTLKTLGERMFADVLTSAKRAA